MGELPAKSTESFPIGSGLALFNGNSAHSVNKFEGQRYSVVYFTASCHSKLDPEDISILKGIGMPYPPPSVDEFALLRIPRGYNGKGLPAAAKGSDSQLPASRFWTRHTMEKQRFKEKPWAKKALKEWEEQCSKLSKKAFVLRRPTTKAAASEETPPEKRTGLVVAESVAK